MEDLVIAFPSKEITFENEKVQFALKNFESNLRSRNNVDLYFLVDLYELKRAWCDNAFYPSATDFVIQKYGEGRFDYYTFNQFKNPYNINKKDQQKLVHKISLNAYLHSVC